MSRVLSKLKRDGVKGLVKGTYTQTLYKLRDNLTYYFPRSHNLFYRKPHVVFVETTNHCNLHCRMCYRGKRESGEGFMPFPLFKKVVDECAEIGDVCLVPHFAGETTLHPEFNDMIRYVMSKRDKLYNVGFFTNGSLMDKNRAQLLVDSQVDWITFSMDGIGKVYEDIRLGAKYDVLEQNLLNFINIRGKRAKPTVTINVTMSSQSDEQLIELRDRWTGKVDFVNFNGCINENFKILNADQWHQWNSKYKFNKFCTQPFIQIGVYWNGDATFCCHDLNGKGYVGNANESSLMDIWRSEEFKQIRKGVLNGHRVNLCAGCEKQWLT